MVNKRFQKFLFLLLAIVTLLSFTILPVFSDTNDKNIFTLAYYLGIFSGVVCIILGIFGLIKGSATRGMLAIGVGSIVIGISSYINAILIGINFLNFIALGFMVAISSGCFYFLGYIFAKDPRIVKYSKYAFDASAIIAFIGIFIVELLIFSQYVNISKMPITECKDNISFFETQRFFFCIFLGSELKGEQPSWMQISFFLFGFIIPFSVMFALVYGLFFGAGLHQLFGRYGKGVVGVIAFATAMFGVRQLIGIFLIDLLAYGVWGIFGIIISFIVFSMVRYTGRIFLKDIEEIERSVYGEFLVTDIVKLDQIKDELEKFHKAIYSETITPDALKAIGESLTKYINILEGIKQSKDIRVSAYAIRLYTKAKELEAEVSRRISSKESTSSSK